MPDQYRLAPYGDAVIVNTPTLDNVAKQLYAQQQVRQAKQQQENQAMDQMLQKDLGRIRSVDTPDVVNGYNKVKTIKKQLLFDKSLQKDPLAYNKKQQELNDARVELNGVINGSAEIKESNRAINSAHLKDPMEFSDDYGKMMATQMNTPLSQLRNHPVYGDLTNQDTYRYVGPNYDFNTDLSKIYDKKNKVIGKEEALDDKGIQFRSPVYEYGTPPAQVFDGLVGSMTHEKERAAAKKWNELTPEVVQKIEQDYSSIPQSKWEQMGLPGPQDMPLRSGSNAEKYLRVLAMQNAVNTNPRLINYENRTSDKAKSDYNFAQDKVMEALRFGHAKQLKKEEQSIVDNWVVGYWDKRFNEAKSSPSKTIISNDPNNQLAGKFKAIYQLNPDQMMMEALKKGSIYPDDVYVTRDNNILPVFYKYKNRLDANGKVIGTEIEKDKKGNKMIDMDMTNPLGLDQAYLSMGYKGQTKKGLGSTMNDVYEGNKGNQAPKVEDLRKKYNY